MAFLPALNQLSQAHSPHCPPRRLVFSAVMGQVDTRDSGHSVYEKEKETQRGRRPAQPGPVPACFPFLCGRAVSGKGKRMSYPNPRGYLGPSDPAHCPSSSVVSFLNCVETASSWSQKAASDFSYIMLLTPVEFLASDKRSHLWHRNSSHHALLPPMPSAGHDWLLQPVRNRVPLKLRSCSFVLLKFSCLCL